MDYCVDTMTLNALLFLHNINLNNPIEAIVVLLTLDDEIILYLEKYMVLRYQLFVRFL